MIGRGGGVAMELFSQEGLEREFSFEKRHQKPKNVTEAKAFSTHVNR